MPVQDSSAMSNEQSVRFDQVEIGDLGKEQPWKAYLSTPVPEQPKRGHDSQVRMQKEKDFHDSS